METGCFNKMATVPELIGGTVLEEVCCSAFHDTKRAQRLRRTMHDGGTTPSSKRNHGWPLEELSFSKHALSNR